MANNTKSNEYKPTRIDVTFLILSPIVTTLITLALPVNLLVSTLLLFGPPALYISYKRKDIIKRSLIYALAATIISILTDYLAEQDQSWVSTSMFHGRLAGIVPIEALLWVFMLSYLILIYYQFFYDHSSHKLIGKRMPYVFIAVLAVIVWISLLAITGIGSFKVEYYYIKFGLAFILLPLLAFIFAFPQYLKVLLKTIPYFTALGLINILVSLHKGHWSYPGDHFIGWVQLGRYRFPLEELLFWIILYTPFLISQFEFFNNDRLKLNSASRSSKT